MCSPQPLDDDLPEYRSAVNDDDPDRVEGPGAGCVTACVAGLVIGVFAAGAFAVLCTWLIHKIGMDQ